MRLAVERLQKCAVLLRVGVVVIVSGIAGRLRSAVNAQRGERDNNETQSALHLSSRK
jgi:hypothetical protein